MKSNTKRSGIKVKNKITGVTVVLIKPSRKILLQLRDDGNGKKIDYPNMWTFPGGSREGEEEYVETAAREMKEEFDIDINKNSCKLLMIHSFSGDLNDYTNHLYACGVNEDSRPRLQEGDGLRWATLKEIKKIKLAGGENKIIKKIEVYLKENFYEDRKN
ncbi:MAG: hypothetical protein Athens071426_136 [Parcubacteria group bacterium Athens0714_26]|nr:MAG: hypothetical protein Athens101426_68 [Parcubacteria group bacterium Athens1014_26]TSD03647.1 MAG: hypothetical protein Athens071426_136 [Parcubacteria group bacterium Athens0714_26]